MQSAAPGHLNADPPDAIVISGPEFYKPHVVSLYGGYKRTRNLYGKCTYQKDPDEISTGQYEAYIYWSCAESRWCVGPQLGATVGDVCNSSGTIPVPIYQVTEGDAFYPRLLGTWVANLYGTGARFQADHMLSFEELRLPQEAADPARPLGGYMHICQRRCTDYEFPPKVTSVVGDPPPLNLAAPQRPDTRAVTWRSAVAFSAHRGDRIFDPAEPEPPSGWLGRVPPHRGGLGSVLAAVREYPGHVESLFALCPQVNALGRYNIWLYDIWKPDWRRVTIDDFVPSVPAEDAALVQVDPATGIVSVLQMEAIHGNPVPWAGGPRRALWALLLEKALAKLCGSYEAVHRSDPIALLMALTGDRTQPSRWVRDGCWWSKWRFLEPDRRAYGPQSGTMHAQLADEDPCVHRRVRGSQPMRCAMERVPGTWHQGPELYLVARQLEDENCLLMAYADMGMDIGGQRALGRPCPSGSGLVQGHGYSVLQLVEEEEEGLLLVQLRNIWEPDFRWRGAWAEGSPEWDHFPQVRRHHLRQDHTGSGRFWMCWQDFCAAFDRIDVVPMPDATRKGSHVVQREARGRNPASQITRSAGRTRGRRDASGYFSFFEWKCCAVERAH